MESLHHQDVSISILSDSVPSRGDTKELHWQLEGPGPLPTTQETAVNKSSVQDHREGAKGSISKKSTSTGLGSHDQQWISKDKRKLN